MTLNYRYRVGGSLAWDDPSYVTRAADEHLYNAIHQGLFSKILGPRQTGKSSLRIRTAHRLQQQGTRCASIQATQLGLGPGQDTASQKSAQWVPQLISVIWDSLYPTESQALSQWLQETCQLTPAARLEAFTQAVLLKGTAKLEGSQGRGTAPSKTVIFIDEIDYLLSFPTAAQTFFQWIAQCYQYQPSHSSGLTSGLTFVILGTAIGSDVDSYLFQADSSQDHSSQNLSLLQQSYAITLENFQLSETQPLYQGFQGIIESPIDVLKAIFCWTNGQPFLTQKLCNLVFNFLADLGKGQAKTLRLSPKALGRWVSHMVASEIVDNWRYNDDPAHLRAMSDRITQSPNCTELSELYQRIAIGSPVANDGSRLQAELLMSGLVIVCEQQLQFNNEIYRQVFDSLVMDTLCAAATQSTPYSVNSQRPQADVQVVASI